MVAYLEGHGGDSGAQPSPLDESDYTRAIATPAAAAALAILIVSVIYDDYTDDSPWTSGGVAVAVSFLALAAATAASFVLARKIGATRAGATFASFMVLVVTPVAVIAGYVALAVAGM